MTAIHMFGGESGGIGKSLVCAAAIAYHEAHNIDCIIFDTDRTKPDVYRAHRHLGCELAILSEAERLENGANAIFEAAFEQPVLVNLAAASFIPLTQWLHNNDLVSLAAEHAITFHLWFVLDGTPTGNKLLIRSLQHFKGTIPHIAVRNHGKTTDWSFFDTDNDLIAVLKHYRTPVADFPHFHGQVERQTITDRQLSLTRAAEFEDFGIISRQRVKRFLTESSAVFADLFEKSHATAS